MPPKCVVLSATARRLLSLRLLGLVLASCAAVGLCQADEIELASGSKYKGKLVEKNDQWVTFKAFIGGGSAEMKFEAGRVKKVTIDEATAVPPVVAPAPVRPPPLVAAVTPVSPFKVATPPGPKTQPTPPPAGATATRQQVDDAINSAGRSQPPWWDSVQLNYPQTLDLTSFAVPKGANDPDKYLGQYLWRVVQPNQSRWKETVKLLHQMLTINKDNPQSLAQTMFTLGKFYYDLEDYARAAFWLRKVNAEPVKLARCYYKLGNKQMAEDQILRAQRNDSGMILLYAEMGDLSRAISSAEEVARLGNPDTALMMAGHACRTAGKFNEAMAFYTRVQGLTQGSGRLAKHKEEAGNSLAMLALVKDLDITKIPDGKYSSSCVGFRGPVTVEVALKSGKIESVKVTDHKEDMYFYNIAANRLLPAFVEHQGFAGVDAVSGATITSDAIINATGKALAEGGKGK